jgi:hypothetical protein
LSYDLVDDEFAHIEHQNRHDRADKPKQEACQGERGARLPDQAEKSRKVAQRACSLAERPNA